MVPVGISILLVVLMSGAVLKVVADDRPKPTRVVPPSPPPPPPPPLPRRVPATSRRRPAPLPVPVPVAAPPPAVAMPSRPTFAMTVRLKDPPLPRHRVRSGFLLIVLVVSVGMVVAFVIGAILAALAFGLRAAVTS